VASKMFMRTGALAAALLMASMAAPGAGAQSYPYPQQGYPQGYYPPDPYSQYYGQYYGTYPQQYGPGYNSYGYGGYGYGGPSAYGPPPAYTGYGSAYGPSYAYGAPYQAPGAYGQPPAYPPPSYYAGGYPPPYPGQTYYDANLAAPPLGLPYAPPPTTSPNGFTLTATLTGPNAALLSWNGIPGAVSYALYQAVNNGPLQFASTTTSTSANVPLNYGSVAFQVRALSNGGAELVQSNVATPAPGPALGIGASQNYPTGPGVPSPSNSTVAANVQQGSLFFGTQITVTVLDSGRMPVTGRLVSLVSSRQGYDTITPANGSTPVSDGSGRAFFNVRGGQPGQATFTAYVDNIPIGQTLVNFQ
jgi:hypothetical protein